MAVPLATDLAPARARAPQPDSALHARGLALGEVAFAAVVALAVMAAVTFSSGGGGLFSRRLWLDEYHTLFLVTRGGLLESVGELAQGSDFNPPALFLLTRLALAIAPGDDAIALRLVGFASVWVALVSTYLLLRRRWGRLPATAGALALWSHGLVVYHAFEARFYGPLLALSALFILALVRLRERPSRHRQATLAAAAVALCTIHWFGVLVWGLAMAADVLGRRRREAAEYLVPWPALAGPMALAACLPLYVGQRAALTATTWVDPLSAYGVEKFLTTLFVLKPLTPVAALAAASWALGWAAARRSAPRPAAASTTRSVGAPPDVASSALLLLAAQPLLLLAFSVLAQPVAIARYGIPGVLALAPVVAFLTATAVRPLQYVIVALLLSRSATVVQDTAWEATRFERSVSEMTKDIRAQARPGEVVLVMQRHYLYPLAHDSSLRGTALRLPTYPESAPLDAYETVERDVARVHHRLYGFPPLQPVSALSDAPRLLIVRGPDERRSDLAPVFPGYRITRLTPRLYELTPDTAAARARHVAARDDTGTARRGR